MLGRYRPASSDVGLRRQCCGETRSELPRGIGTDMNMLRGQRHRAAVEKYLGILGEVDAKYCGPEAIVAVRPSSLVRQREWPNSGRSPSTTESTSATGKDTCVPDALRRCTIGPSTVCGRVIIPASSPNNQYTP